MKKNKFGKLFLLSLLICILGSSFTYDNSLNFNSFDLSKIDDDILNAKLEIATSPNDSSYLLSPRDEPYFSRQLQFETIEYYSTYNLTRGEGVKIAIIDTKPQINHLDFYDENGDSVFSLDSALIVGGYSGNTYYTVRDYGLDVICETVDSSKHGTSTMGVVSAQVNGLLGAGIAPEAELVAIALEKATVGEMLGAFQYAYQVGVDIISISMLVYENSFVDSNGVEHVGVSGIKEAIAPYLEALYQENIVVVASAGNEATDQLAYPANSEHVICVGALETRSSTKLASYSNYGHSTIVAPGTVYAPATFYPSSGEIQYNRYGQFEGTSFSAPIVAGALALYKSCNLEANVDELTNALTNSAIDLGAKGYDGIYGYGRLSIANLLNYQVPFAIEYCIYIIVGAILLLSLIGVIIFIIIYAHKRKIFKE